jgi:hypothetical protein
MKLDAAKFVLDTIQIAPSQNALWFVGPTTVEEIEGQEHVKMMRERLQELREKLHE